MPLQVDPKDLRRVKTRFSLCSLDIPNGASEEEVGLVTTINNDLSQEWTGLIMVGDSYYSEQEATDHKHIAFIF